MPRPRSFDEDAVLEGAVRIFQECGLEGASIPQITERLGICRQSLYNAFGGKKALFLKALDLYGQREIDAKLRLLSHEGSPLENVRTVIRGIAAGASQCPSEACFTAATIIEARDDQDMLALVEKQVQRLEQGLMDSLARAQEQGELKPDCKPERLARLLVSIIYGLGILKRFESSSLRIRDTVSLALELIGSWAL